jgi:ribosomal protein L7/L12
MISMEILDKIVETASAYELEHIVKQAVGEQRVRGELSKRFINSHNITQLEDMFVRRRQSVEAIRTYRDRVKCGLVEAKHAIDNYEETIGL